MAAAVALHTSPRMRRLTAILVVRNGQLPISKRAHLSPWRLLYGSNLAVILLSEVPKMLYMEHSPIWRTADRIRKAISWTAFNFDSRHLNLRGYYARTGPGSPLADCLRRSSLYERSTASAPDV